LARYSPVPLGVFDLNIYIKKAQKTLRFTLILSLGQGSVHLECLNFAAYITKVAPIASKFGYLVKITLPTTRSRIGTDLVTPWEGVFLGIHGYFSSRRA
jgi:hypothetical protein